ncbi:MAG: HAMP domain-containing histidine kinase, partial [Chlorobi bacterium]|nr:HAMP domain-containing histidine kinase [Chlorobiota bacterium]
IYTYFSTVEEYERKKLRWIMFGFSVSLIGFLILWVIPSLVFSNGLVPEEFLLLLVLFIPVTFAISIVRYRLLDIDVIIKRSIVYSAVIGLLIIVYAVVIVFITEFLKIDNSVIPPVITALLIALFFQPVNSKTQEFVNKKYFRIQYNFRKVLKSFIDDIRHDNDIKSISGKIIERIEEAIPVEGISVFFTGLSGIQFNGVIQENCKNISQSNFDVNGLTKEIIDSLPLAKKKSVEPDADINYYEKGFIPDCDFELLIPIKSESNNLFGIILLKEKKAGIRYTVEDIDLLSAIAESAASAIERIKLQEELIEEKLETERLVELNELKSLFVSTVSHDLKTPLTSIKMFSEMLRTNRNISPEKRSEYLKIIEGESDRLTRLIDGALDYAKIEKGIKEYHFGYVNLNEVVEEALKLMEYPLKMQKFKVITKLAQRELIIRADKDALIEAMINLISNAVKYSEARKEIIVSAYAADNYFAVSVEDKGIGIKEDELEEVLTPYFRSEDFAVKNKKGTGLGLAIIKHIMNAHGGEIKIKSKIGEGSNFTLLFPLGDGDE